MNTDDRFRHILRAITVLAVACAWCATASASEPRAFVLDNGNNTVIALDTEKGAVLSSIVLEGAGSPATMIQLPSGKVAVLDKGQGKGTARFGWHPTGKSSIHFLDVRAMKMSSRLELSWGIGAFTLTADGKHLVIECPGYVSQKASEELPAELVIVNTETEQVTGRVPLPTSLKRPLNLLLTSDDRTLITFAPASDVKKDQTVPAELQFVDVETGKVLGALTPKKAVTDAALSNDGRYLYLLDPGKPSDKVDKNVDGWLEIVSVQDQAELTSIDVGSGPQGIIRDDARDLTLIISDPDPAANEKRGADGFLRVIKGTETVALSRVAHYPQLVSISPDRSLLYVVGADCLSIVDYSNFKTLERIHMEGDEVDRRDKTDVTDFAISSDGTRGFAVIGNSSKLAVFDLKARKALPSVTTGRGSVKFMKLATVALNNAQPGLDQAFGTAGPGYRTYTMMQVTPAHQSIVMSSNNAYVLNSQTDDVTVVDVSKASVVSKVPLIEVTNRIQMLPGGNVIAVTGNLFLIFIDTKTNQKIKFENHEWLKAGGFASSLKTFRVSPSGTRALAAAGKNITCLDLTTMKVVTKLDFQDPQMILFERQ